MMKDNFKDYPCQSLDFGYVDLQKKFEFVSAEKTPVEIEYFADVGECI